MSESNKPAFPISENDTHYITAVGLTKRELFAAMAMQGLLADTNVGEKIDDDPFVCNLETFEAIAKCSVTYADALLGALAEEKP